MLNDRQAFIAHLNNLYSNEEALRNMRKVLNLNNNVDVVEYCKNKILNNCKVYRKNTSLCCEIDGVVITIDPPGQTIIRAR